MKNRIKFYIDEHAQKAVAKGLRRRGVDVITVVQAGLRGATDEEHLESAKSEKRVIFTQDDDFLRLHAACNIHSGIVDAHQGKAIGALISGLMLIYQALKAEDMINHVEYLQQVRGILDELASQVGRIPCTNQQNTVRVHSMHQSTKCSGLR